MGLFSLGVLVFSSAFFAWGNEEFTLFETLRYHPARKGLRNLEFEVRVSGLREMLNNAQSFGAIEELYYHVAWSPENGHRVNVVGPPQGLEDLRERLRASILPKLDFVVPSPLTAFLAPYTFERLRRGEGITLKGKDKTGRREINAVDVQIDGRGLIEEIRTSSSRGIESWKMKYERHRGTDNKYVVVQQVVETLLARQKRVVEMNVDYMAQSGYALPEEIRVKTEVFMVTGAGVDAGGSKKSEVQESSFRFSNYKIN